MEYSKALDIAQEKVELLRPDCDRIEIAGSLRRKVSEVKDIEIVAIPKPYEVGLFGTGIYNVVSQWEAVKGQLPCKYTQRILPEGIILDLFFANPRNWGLILAIRTGPKDYSHHVLAAGWCRKRYHSVEGMLTCEKTKQILEMREEEDLFKWLGMDYVKPENRFYVNKEQ